MTIIVSDWDSWIVFKSIIYLCINSITRDGSNPDLHINLMIINLWHMFSSLIYIFLLWAQRNFLFMLNSQTHTFTSKNLQIFCMFKMYLICNYICILCLHSCVQLCMHICLYVNMYTCMSYHEQTFTIRSKKSSHVIAQYHSSHHYGCTV
jgi:hypothetical protein